MDSTTARERTLHFCIQAVAATWHTSMCNRSMNNFPSHCFSLEEATHLEFIWKALTMKPWHESWFATSTMSLDMRVTRTLIVWLHLLNLWEVLNEIHITENFKADLCLWRASEAMESRPTECDSNPQSLLFPPGANIS